MTPEEHMEDHRQLHREFHGDSRDAIMFEEERQVIILALTKLWKERPGWEQVIKRILSRYSGEPMAAELLALWREPGDAPKD